MWVWQETVGRPQGEQWGRPTSFICEWAYGKGMTTVWLLHRVGTALSQKVTV